MIYIIQDKAFINSIKFKEHLTIMTNSKLMRIQTWEQKSEEEKSTKFE